MIARPCRKPGCPAVATSQGYCNEHAKPAERERRRLHDAKRPKTSDRGYGWDWQKVRDRHVKREPLCRECARNGRVTPVEDVHHIDGDTWNRSEDNLMSLCRACHNQLKAKG